MEDGLVPQNPARGRRMRVRVPKPRRTCLEIDELACLFEAAADQDDPLANARLARAKSPSAAAVAELAAQWLRPGQISERLGISLPTVTYHLRRLGVQSGRGYAGRQMICEMLGRGGVRAGELRNMRIGDVRPRDPAGARFAVPESKTEAGVRMVEMSPALAAMVNTHIARLRLLDLPSDPRAYLVPNLRGGKLSQRTVGRIVKEAASLAGARLVAKGMAQLPYTTPHTLRRTYISIALVANKFDVKFVMSQVGHASSAMTMDVYAQLEQRAKRSHGANFDRLLAEAGEQIRATAPATPTASSGTVVRASGQSPKTAYLQGV